MKGNFFARAGLTLGVVASALSLFAGFFLFLTEQSLPGLILMLCCPVFLVCVFIALARSRKSDDEMDVISKSGRIARQSKNPPTKKVFEHDADIWDQMKGS